MNVQKQEKYGIMSPDGYKISYTSHWTVMQQL